MSNDVNISAKDVETNGTVRLYANNLKYGGRYYGKFKRNLVNSRTLYARIQKKNAGTSLHEVQKIIGMLKEVIIEAIQAGEAVNLMDLMTVYISVCGRVNGAFIENNGKSPLSVKITPSSTLKKAANTVSIKNVDYASADMKIEQIFDRFTQCTDGTVTRTAEVQLKGRRLKTKGNGDGVWLCPVDADGKTENDENKWLACNKITQNTATRLAFYLPAAAQAGCKYRIFVKTVWLSGNRQLKTPKTTLSGIVTVKAAE